MVRSFIGTLAALSVLVAAERAGFGWGLLVFVGALAGCWLLDLTNDRALAARDDRQLPSSRAWRSGANLHGQ